MKSKLNFKYLIFIIFTLFYQFLCNRELQAQHCRWDGMQIMVFSIKANPSDSMSINNLKVTVADSLGKSVFFPYYYYKGASAVQATVFQNQANVKCNVKKITETLDVRCFWFASNNYVLVAPQSVFTTKGIHVIVEDIDSMENSGNFKNLMIPLNTKYAFHLCSNYSLWQDGPEMGFIKEYQVVQRIPERK